MFLWRRSSDAPSNEASDDGSVPPRPNARNYANLVGYVINVFFTFAVGTLKIFGNEDIGTVSQKYQVIITPAGYAFSIWSVIFIFQAIFVIIQFLPRYRGHPLVQSGVGYWYLVACACQAVWSIAFCFEVIWASLALIIGVWLSLVGIVTCQYYAPASLSASTPGNSTKEGQVQDDPNSRCCRLAEFWLLKFPFDIHCGWITAATSLNVNIMFLASGADAATQLTTGIVTLAVLHAVALFVLFVPNRPNYTIPLVLLWANAAIAVELSNPSDSIRTLFSQDIISAVQNAAAAVSVIIIILVVVRILLSLGVRWCSQRQAGGGKAAEVIEAETGQEVLADRV